MKYLNYIFRCVIMTLIVLPIWVFTCVAGFITAIILHYLFYFKRMEDLKYRNNMKSIYRDFKQDLFGIFIFY